MDLPIPLKYLYYALLAVKLKVPWRRMVTKPRLVQFFIESGIHGGVHLFGGYMSVGPAAPTDAIAHFLGTDKNYGRLIAVATLYIYTFIFIMLFLDFSKKIYRTDKIAVDNQKSNDQ